MDIRKLAIALVAANVVLMAASAALLSRRTVATEARSVVRAQRIELLDAAGTVRALLSTEDDGTVVFRLRDRDGNIRVKLGADERGSALLLADDTSEVGIHLLSGVSRITNQRSTMITLADPGGEKRSLRPGP